MYLFHSRSVLFCRFWSLFLLFLQLLLSLDFLLLPRFLFPSPFLFLSPFPLSILLHPLTQLLLLLRHRIQTLLQLRLLLCPQRHVRFQRLDSLVIRFYPSHSFFASTERLSQFRQLLILQTESLTVLLVHALLLLVPLLLLRLTQPTSHHLDLQLLPASRLFGRCRGLL